MLKNISTIPGNIFHFGNRTTQNTSAYHVWQNQSEKKAANREKISSIKRMLSEDGASGQSTAYSAKTAESSFSYAESLRMARTKAKNTALKLKRLRYDYKSISTQILRCKTSVSARQVASKARREVIRLKRQRLNGEYNDEELKSAIVHAQAMVRVAKKKARHLQEEEMAKVTGGPCNAELEEREERENQLAEEAVEEWEAATFAGTIGDGGASLQENAVAAMQEKMQIYREMTQFRMAERQKIMEEQQDMMIELMDETWDSMEEMLKNSGLDDLAESMMETVDVEMDPADYKMMKIKHRSEEMKAIAEADAEYLKALFNRLEKAKSSGVHTPSGSGGGTPSTGVSSGGSTVSAGGGSAACAMPVQGAGGATVAMPSAAEVAGVGFDVSV